MMYWYGNGMSGWGYALMAIGLVLFWGAVIFGIVALVRSANRGRQRGGDHHEPATPERLLGERFARGEIDEEEYRRRLAALQDAGRPQVPADGQAGPPVGTGAR